MLCFLPLNSILELIFLSCAGNVECSSIIYSWSIYTSNYDCCALLLWSQCCISTCSTGWVQSEETIFISLWPPSFGFSGNLLSWHTNLVFLLNVPLHWGWRGTFTCTWFMVKNFFLVPKYFSFQTILCGLIGIPPSNGVIPQSPMHTKSLATLKHQVLSSFTGP